ncbi:DNA-binding response regulator [Tepidanaerobacter syntrophicus]|uniref:Stage 0 sporulation protein A homolog n=1 Tax=Tepidanaerobacter syntrophicus TaxID=224999 RepID=A0A0U9HFT2_9FIRM|nr:LytTR family DNA-binding domain-containing protein [Tepidanaerobacter syntrophicus]GAQ25382.1 two-component system, LytT family, response regulator [Tepidanaerobacter syntrophicus]GLI20173.1 DNA-binding response regulator [Tepidanaerobacter syntrophicus]GLI50940.1 DNA-binding response regulator [Tepidanaerobacter syntrophicus]
MELRTLIVDDETPAREELSFLLLSYPNVKVIGEAASGKEAIELAERLKPDVIFLDIKMWDLNGFETAKIIFQRGIKPFIVFATAYDEYAIKAFEINAIDYILKPFSKERLDKTINRIINLSKNNENSLDIYRFVECIETINKSQNIKIPVWKNNRIYLLNPQDINYFEACEKGSKVMALQGEFETNCCLSELEDRLKDLNFFRTHKSFLVNMDKVLEIVPWFNGTYILSLKDYEKNEVPVSRRCAKKLRERLQI